MARMQRAHERNVHHGALVEDDGVARERVVLVAPEGDVLMIVAHTGLEQAVDRLRAPAGQLAHALGGAAVGAASWVSSLSTSNSARIARMDVVLPVPGPPVIAMTWC